MVRPMSASSLRGRPTGPACPNQTELFTGVPPTGVRPGTNLSSSSRTSNSREARPPKAEALTGTSDKSGKTAGALVAAYIDSYERTWGRRPISSIISRIGRDAKLLLRDEIDYDAILDAAKELGTTEYANLSTVTHRLLTRRENDPRYHSWQNVRTIAPYPVSSDPEAVCGTGPVDAQGTWGRETAVAPRWDDAGPSNWDQAEPWHAEDHYDDYDGDSFENDDVIREAYL